MQKPIAARRVAIILADNFNDQEYEQVRSRLEAAGAYVKVISKFKGMLTGQNGMQVEVDKSYVTTASVLFDAVFVPGGKHCETLMEHGDALAFLAESYKHFKPIGATSEAIELLKEARLKGATVPTPDSTEPVENEGVVCAWNLSDFNGYAELFIQAMMKHRHWGRGQKADMVMA
jgi:catalase